MDVRDFDFDLPSELIAQEPPAERRDARLLHLDRHAGTVVHTTISNLPALLHPDDLVVVNNTRVFAARLLGRREPTGGAVECLLVQRVSNESAPAGEEMWEALVHPGQKLKPGSRILFGGSRPLHGEILERRFYGRRLVRLWTEDESPVEEAVDAIGHVPLPPYIKRADRPADRMRYQTMFADSRGSVAAPTAGLHFDAPLVAALEQAGIELAKITLHVGYGTFQPVRVEQVEEHRVEPSVPNQFCGCDRDQRRPRRRPSRRRGRHHHDEGA